LYLWHWPIFEMTRPGADIGWSPVPTAILRLVLTGAAAEFSYRYVERPWRDGRAQVTLRRWFSGWSAPRALVSAGAPLLLVAAILATAPGPDEPAVLAEGATAAARTAPTTSPSTVPIALMLVNDDA